MLEFNDSGGDARTLAERRRTALNRMYKRVVRVTRDGPAWRDWWVEVIRVLAQTDHGLGELESLLLYAETAADPGRGDMSPLRKPGAWMVSKLLAWARGQGVRLPEMPK